VGRRLQLQAVFLGMPGVSPWRLRDLIASGKLRSVRMGARGLHRMQIEEVERLIGASLWRAPRPREASVSTAATGTVDKVSHSCGDSSHVHLGPL